MQILLIHNFSRNFNGEDAFYLSQLRLLKENKHNVTEWTRNNNRITSNLFSKMKIVKGLYFPEIEKELSKIVRENRFDIVHIHNIFPLITPVVYRICKNFGIPTIQTIHNYRFMCPKAVLFRDGKVCELCVRKQFPYPSMIFGCYHGSYAASAVFAPAFYYHKNIAKSFDSIDTYIFPASFTRDYYVKNLKLSSSKTVLLPYFVSVVNRKTKEQVKKNYFLFVGRLSEEKGIIELLEVFKTLPYQLVIIGDGPLKKQVSEYKKYKNIEIKKFLSRGKVFSYMQNAISTIIPSLWYEVLPMVMLESFANGTPVIVPKFGTFINAVRNGETGLFYKQYDFDDLKAKILYAWKHKEILRQMGLNARNECETKYTPEIHYEKLMKVYKSVLR